MSLASRIMRDVSSAAVSQLVKMNASPSCQNNTRCTPPNADAEFVYRREDILQAYRRTHQPRSPEACLDDATKPPLADLDVLPQRGPTGASSAPTLPVRWHTTPLLQRRTAASPDNPTVATAVGRYWGMHILTY
jgi:hypothetical protein